MSRNPWPGRKSNQFEGCGGKGNFGEGKLHFARSVKCKEGVTHDYVEGGWWRKTAKQTKQHVMCWRVKHVQAHRLLCILHTHTQKGAGRTKCYVASMCARPLPNKAGAGVCVCVCFCRRFGETKLTGPHLPDRLVAMLLLEFGELRLLCRDLLGQHALQRGQRPLAAGKAAEGALAGVSSKCV